MKSILKVEYGSRMFGTNTEFSDRDMYEIVVEGPEYVTGVRELKSKVHHTSGAERSTKDDTDTQTHGLRKFVGLAMSGNPTPLSALYAPADLYETLTPMGAMLRTYRGLFTTKRTIHTHRAMMHSHVQTLVGARNKRTNRPELVHLHGYDTKWGYHAMRVGFLGRQLVTTGEYQLPFEGEAYDTCMAIRAGQVPLEDLLKMTQSLEKEIETLSSASSIPDNSDVGAVSALTHKIYLHEWGVVS